MCACVLLRHSSEVFISKEYGTEKRLMDKNLNYFPSQPNMVFVYDVGIVGHTHTPYRIFEHIQRRRPFSELAFSIPMINGKYLFLCLILINAQMFSYDWNACHVLNNNIIKCILLNSCICTFFLAHCRDYRSNNYIKICMSIAEALGPMHGLAWSPSEKEKTITHRNHIKRKRSIRRCWQLKIISLLMPNSC